MFMILMLNIKRAGQVPTYPTQTKMEQMPIYPFRVGKKEQVPTYLLPKMKTKKVPTYSILFKMHSEER